jgi:hypothetical protein
MRLADGFKQKPEVEVSRWLIQNNGEKLLYVVVYPKLQKNPLWYKSGQTLENVQGKKLTGLWNIRKIGKSAMQDAARHFLRKDKRTVYIEAGERDISTKSNGVSASKKLAQKYRALMTKIEGNP